MGSTMGVWPQSTSRAKPSTLATLRIQELDVHPLLKEGPPSFQPRTNRFQTLTSHAFPVHSSAHSIRLNGLPLQRHLPEASFVPKSSTTASRTFTKSYAAYRTLPSIYLTQLAHYRHTLQDITAYFPLQYQQAHIILIFYSQYPKMVQTPPSST